MRPAEETRAIFPPPAILVSRTKVFISVLCLCLYYLLDFGFVHVIQYNYAEFEKFHNGDPGITKIVLSHFIPLLLTILLIVLPSTRMMYVILVLQLVIIVYPAATLCRHINADYRILMLHSIYFISLYSISNSFRLRIKLPALAHHQQTIFLLLLAAILIVPFVIIFGPYVDFSNFLLQNIYESRAIEARLSNAYTGYVYAPLSSVILPLLLLLASRNREYLKAVASLVMLMFMFLVGGHKSVFFGIFLLIYFSYGSYYRKLVMFLFGLIFIATISIAAYVIYDDLFLTSLVSHRVFFLPAILDVGYFDYFDGRPLFWSESIFKHFLTYPYALPAKNLVSEHVINDVLSNANNGIVSDGFMNFGVTGALINIFFVSIVFGILNSLNIHHRFFGIIFLLFFTFFSSFFFTSMLTQGGILLLIIAYFFLKDTANDPRYD